MRILQTSQAQRLEAMGRLRYFESWTVPQRTALANASSIIAVGKNIELVSRGTPLQHLYVIINGEFRFFMPIPGGTARSLGALGEGSSFGEGCIQLDTHCPYSVLSTRNSHVLAIDAEVYRQELSKSTILLGETLRLCSQRLINMLGDVEICGQRTSLQRVACYLGQFQPDGESLRFRITLPERKMDIATRIGLTPETFSRSLSQLEQQGILVSKGKDIEVLDAFRLRQINQGEGPQQAGTSS
jgi:CRP-like cAMP-binding protein